MAGAHLQIQSSRLSERPPTAAWRCVSSVEWMDRATAREQTPPVVLAGQPLSNARATNRAFPPRSKRAGAGGSRTAPTSTNLSGMARGAQDGNPGRSQILVVSSLALDKPLKQQAHSEGSLVRGGLQQSGGAIRLASSRLLARYRYPEVAQGLREGLVCGHLAKHHRVSVAPPSLKAVTP